MLLRSIFAIAIVLTLTAIASGASLPNVIRSVPSLPPELYEICASQFEIHALQESLGLITVQAIPQKAAMHPSWPETTISILFFLVTGILYIANSGEETTLGFFALLLPLIESVCWTISYAFIEHEKTTGG